MIAKMKPLNKNTDGIDKVTLPYAVANAEEINQQIDTIFADPLLFWNSEFAKKEFPRVHQVAFKALSKAVASVKDESNFSLVKHTVKASQSRMLEKQVNARVCHKCWNRSGLIPVGTYDAKLPSKMIAKSAKIQKSIPQV